MSKAKFKTGDLVENIHTGEVEQIARIEYTRTEGHPILYMNTSTCLYYIGIRSEHYRLISPKSVKFNLK